MVDFGAAEQAPAGQRTTSSLQAAQDAKLTGRRRPELPGRNAARMPLRAAIGAGVLPNVDMPAEAEDRLAANTAEARAAVMGGFAEWSRRRTKPAGRRSLPTPVPVRRCLAPPRERTREAVGTHRMSAPVAFDRKARTPWHERLPVRVDQHGTGEQIRHECTQLCPSLCVLLVPPSRHRGRSLRIAPPWLLYRRRRSERHLQAHGRVAAVAFSKASIWGRFVIVRPTSSRPFRRQCLRNGSTSKWMTPPSGPRIS